MSEMKTGTVKFFNEEKGFGFIKVDNENKEIFVHKNETSHYLREHDQVKFEIQTGQKGDFACKVDLVE